MSCVVSQNQPPGDLRLRIVVIGPPAGVQFQLQRGTRDLEPPARRTDTATTFDFVVRVGTRPDGAPNFLGPYAQGRPAARFVYVNSGTLAGQPDSCWTRRAKIPLGGITWQMIQDARRTEGAVEAEIDGTARDGGPACATVPLRTPWRIVSAS
jgi:Family of unknown function (DUF5990)